jgi:CRP-like cAMP-binding protein
MYQVITGQISRPEVHHIQVGDAGVGCPKQSGVFFERRMVMDAKMSFAHVLMSEKNTIAFNGHPESIKRFTKNNIPTPNIVVIGDTAVYQQVALCSPEFLLLNLMFREKGFDFATGQVLRPLILVGEEERVGRHLAALRLAFNGPSRAEYRSQLRVSQPVRETQLAASNFFALKDRGGEAIPFSALVRPVCFDKSDRKALFTSSGEEIEICHTGEDSYRVRLNGFEQSVALTPAGEIGPAWPLPELSEIEVPHHFRTFVLGSDNAFGPGPTTGFLIEINGEYLLWDCPPYCSWTLRHNGILPGHIREIILSHIHDDHANDFIPFIFNSQNRIKLTTTREIQYSLLVKLEALLNKPAQTIEPFFQWNIVKVGQVEHNSGYHFDFHYGFHPIPSLGVTISGRNGPEVVISGDTCSLALLEKAQKAGAITPTHQAELARLPAQGQEGIVFLDGGGAQIHGELEELARFQHPNIQIYHLDALPPAYQIRLNLVRPGQFYAARPMPHEIVHMNLITISLINMGVRDWPKWSKIVASESKIQAYGRHHLILQEDSPQKEFMYIIAHGEVEVIRQQEVIARLQKGDFFGEQAFMTGHTRNATVRARTPIRLIALPGDLFLEMIKDDAIFSQHIFARPELTGNATIRLQRIWQNRQLLTQLSEFDSLPALRKNELCCQLTEQEFAPGELIVRAGSQRNDVYIVKDGSVEVMLNQSGRANPVLNQNSIFGENVSLGFCPTRNATVRAIEHTRLLVLKGEVMRDLFDEVPSIKHTLTELAGKREMHVLH